jgi:hypothetical protein
MAQAEDRTVSYFIARVLKAIEERIDRIERRLDNYQLASKSQDVR